MADPTTAFTSAWAQRMQFIMTLIEARVRDELVNQGHVLTGALRDSIRGTVRASPGLIEGLLSMEEYGEIIDKGIPADRVPFGGTGGGGTSEYIQGLVSFFMLRGEDEKSALQRAFQTAHTASRLGHPTPGSFFYSNNGRRTGFVTHTLDSLMGEIRGLLERAATDAVTRAFIAVVADEQGRRMERITIFNLSGASGSR